MHASTLQDASYQMIAESGGNISISAESELNAGQGYPATGAARDHGIPISLSMDTSVWWSADMFSATRATLNADCGIDHVTAHAASKTVINNDLRPEDVIHYATQGGADALGLGSSLGSITPGKLATWFWCGPVSTSSSTFRPCWTEKSTPVFQRNDSAGIYGPGHNGFFSPPDGSENWIVYHANDAASEGCDNGRTTRAQKFTWNADGTPNLGTPVRLGASLSSGRG